MDQLITDNDYVLQKFPGKGGWTYAAIPEIKQDKKAPFGWVKVKGFVDGFELKNYKLMPMGNSSLFLPVKAEIRKKIKKEAGDTVRVRLFLDNTQVKIPEEILICLENESYKVRDSFLKLKESEQKLWIYWIYEAKKDETKVSRIVCLLKTIAENQSFFNKIIT
ncbi:YdeI/OmpD-associated family protein [Chondrinema litorale]|uniref:YdeI/OmpD-associated family protein n=1 Tax=Chondrinema litorale TaxID=2994555 RepID=UPI002542BBB3|nr:YdeI/OmpD-associated family protein [Chondrinema litorale]UZR98218.1 YdeI/OmpD-associated family protein [Chondrinema litorale]